MSIRCRDLLPLLVTTLVPLQAAESPAKTRTVESYGQVVTPPAPDFQSFEGEGPFAAWQIQDGGSLVVTDERAKDGRQSLHWSFVRGSRLRLEPFTAFARIDDPKLGFLRLWIYNPRPIADVLRLRIGEHGELAAGQARYAFTFGLDFQGWRALWFNRADRWAANPGYTGTLPPDTLEILAPDGVAGGGVYLDNVESDQKPGFAISTDRQLPIIDQGENSREYRISRIKPPEAPLPPVSPAQRAEIAAITDRLDQFYFPAGVDYAHLEAKDPLRIRYDSLQRFAQQKVAEYDRLGLRRDGDGRLHGPPCYGPRDAKKPKYTELEKTWIGLLADWKLNQRTESRQRLLDLLEHVHDQGYADGSTAGFTGIDHIRMDGWAIAAYALRRELAECGRLDDEIATMKWYTLFGLVYRYDPLDLTYSFETDYIRGSLLFQLTAILMMPDSPEKVRDLRCFAAFVDQLATPRSGLRGGMKPDHILFHHNNAYMGAYGLEALNAFGQIAHVLAGTSFALAPESLASIKQALLAYRNSANTYSLHLGLYGRMPEIVDPLLGLVGPFAYLGLDGDRDLASIFLDLWRPGDPRVQETFAKATNSITYHTTLGQMVLLQQAQRRFTAAGVAPAAPPAGCWVYPYGSYAVHRRNAWMVSCRGLSPQAMNYEYGIDGYDQNPWGRYVNFATTLVYYPAGNLGSGIDTGRGWDWNRWPGSTAIRLPLEELKYGKHHYYGDEPFVGGVTSGGRDGIFAMRLHDPAEDTSFRADISRFFFGDEVICLGSGIRNGDAAHPTETTLFQSALAEGADLPFQCDAPTPIRPGEFHRSFTAPTAAWLVDPHGTGYVIPDARGLQVERRRTESFTHLGVASAGLNTAAWIDHGPAPDGASYVYVILPGSTPAQVQARARTPDFTVLQQDQAAHVVRLATGGTVGYALFAAAPTLGHGVLQAVSAPALVIEARPAADRLRLSVADPDLRMGRTARYASREITPEEIKPSRVQPLRVALRGTWTCRGNLPAGFHLVSEDTPTGTTVFQIDAVDGRTFEIELEGGR